MRVEATVPDSRGAALNELADQLGLSRSQVIDEALSLFLMAVMEVRRGRRFVALGREGDERTELMTPTLAQLEWMFSEQPLALSQEAVERMAELIESPPLATDALRAALDDGP